jgi:hypothetical protein
MVNVSIYPMGHVWNIDNLEKCLSLIEKEHKIISVFPVTIPTEDTCSMMIISKPKD